MSIKLSYFFADFFVARKWIREEDKIIYVVGMDVILSTTWQIMIILLLGAWRKRIIEAVVYLAFFLSVRKYSGGYHASTRTGCFIFCTIAYLAADEISCRICTMPVPHFLLVYGICSMMAANLVFYLFAPIRNERKIYTEKQQNEARGKSFIYLNIWVCSALAITYILPSIAGEIFLTSNIVTMLILLCKPWRKKT
ncbi:MAG: accessory gene regulator B family protein [Ruminococcus sp.]|nr:accessory gene regulator B family protein [Ruminococcus sp.]